MWLKRNLPNLLTLANLFCGVLACLLATQVQRVDTSKHLLLQILPAVVASVLLQLFLLLIVLAAVFDVLDGMVARWLRSDSPMGAQLDSLADLVSFGLAPALLLYAMLDGGKVGAWKWLPLLLPLFSAWRLARFNVRQHLAPRRTFEGLPTPANGLYVTALALALDGPLYALLFKPWAIGFLVLLQCWLLVSRVPFLSQKLPGLGLRHVWPHLLLALLAGIAVGVWGWGAAPAVLLLYLLVSLLAARWQRAEGTPA